MNKQLRQHIFRDIKQSFGRFMSILLISALGVAFFTGVLLSPQAMKDSSDAYYDTYNLMDIRVISTLGLTDDDVDALQNIEGVKDVYPTFEQDVLVNLNNSEHVIKVHGYDAKNPLNQPHLVEGRLPEAAHEIVVEDNDIFSHLELGAEIELLSGTDEPLSDTLKQTTYTIVGKVQSPYYIALMKGSSAIGSGQVSSYVMIPEANFTSDIYTDIYLSVEEAKSLSTYTTAYDNVVKPVLDNIESVSSVETKRRLDEIKAEAFLELDEKTKEYEAGREEAKTELAKAEDELQSGREQYEQGVLQLEAGREEASVQFANAESELKRQETDLLAGEKQLQAGYDEFMNAKPAALEQLEKSKAAIKTLEKQHEEAKAQQVTVETALQNEALTTEERQALVIQLEAVKQGVTTLDTTLKTANTELAKGEATLIETEEQLTTNLQNVKDGKAAIASGYQQLKTEKTSAEVEFSQAEAELETAKAELEHGEATYQEQKAEVEAELNDAALQIEQARADIESIEQPEWFILDRNMHYSYVDYLGAIDGIEAISKVFPVFFFAVSALVCLTTMTRMVDENRLTIGTLKGLGYSNASIASKFLIYAAVASIVGGILGALIGFSVFPNIIIDAYAIIYAIPLKVVNFDMMLVTLAIVVSTLVTTLATYSAVRTELREMPSLLLRPKAPKDGKRILIERIPFVWNRLSFIAKVTVRNIFRYKKRFFMTVIGISGCTALLLSGFGIQDSIQTVIERQFDDLYRYDVSVSLAEELAGEKMSTTLKDISKVENVSATSLAGNEPALVSADDIEQSVTLFVPNNKEELTQSLILRDRLSHESVTIEESGVVISEKLALLFDLSVGDVLRVEQDDTEYELLISDITEHYVNHYVYMSASYYEEVFNKAPQMQTLLVTLEDASLEDEFTSAMMSRDDVKSVMTLSSFKESMENTISSLNYVVLLMIVSAGALAFVVLYNLTNVNISERIREIATIKVLGFYDNEVASYIYRENLVLTLIGTGAGLLVGVVLHRFIMTTVELDNMMFGRNVSDTSFMYATVLTLVFALFVNLAMAPKLKNVQMVESLKSVD